MWIESQAFIEDSTGRFHVQRSCECVPMARRGPCNITFQGARPWHRTRSRHPDDTFCLRQVEYDAVLCGALNKTLACLVEEVSSISLHQCIAQRCWGALLASCETQWALAVQFLHGMQALALKRQRRSSKSSSSLFSWCISWAREVLPAKGRRLADAVAINSAINAADKSHRWELALLLLRALAEMDQSNKISASIRQQLLNDSVLQPRKYVRGQHTLSALAGYESEQSFSSSGPCCVAWGRLQLQLSDWLSYLEVCLRLAIQHAVSALLRAKCVLRSCLCPHALVLLLGPGRLTPTWFV